ncbi:MAG: BrnA antitoxin family protein [Parvibaculum sp.]|nr:BrnA antitoxin family protein [Parvibaculum sp.]|tara:strand:- start:313 stop:597 length:285 start_codon:yes stop_codon:yes gene_type:complete
MSKKPDPTLIDDDNPEWTSADFKRARPAAEVLPADLLAILPKRKRGERGPQKTPTKEQVTLRLDNDVLAYFKENGPGWQTRINDTLKKSMTKAK